MLPRFGIVSNVNVASYKDIYLDMLRSFPNSFSTTFNEALGFSDLSWQNQINKWSTAGGEKMIFVGDATKILGMIGYEFDWRSKRKHIATIINFYVRPEAQKLGYGKFLLEQIITEIRSKGFKLIRLNVTEEASDAYKLYLKFDFKEVGFLDKDIFTQNGYIATRIMQLEL